MKLKTLIADDEPLARERLKLLLSKHEDVEIIGECRNGRETVAALRTNVIDLLFLDIQMPGSDGFEVIKEIGTVHMPITIFVTAHHQHALRAFEVHALDYLTKPVEPERLRAAVLQVRERFASKAALLTQEQLKSVLASLQDGAIKQKPHPQRLLVHNGTKDVFINVNEIEWIEAADYYACLHVGTKSFMLRQPLKELVSTLDPKKFVRIHRSVMVNVNQVREILREGRSEGSVILANGKRLRMSKIGWRSLLAVGRS
jgi:two-component system, LytTR family, response regulator